MKYDQFKANFPYKGKAVYATVFERQKDSIKTKKQKFAVNNLEKIFKATFKLTSKIGFHEMSLRDLCRETGLSMGGVYSCIDAKDTIAIFVKDLVQMVINELLDEARSKDDPTQALDDLVHQCIYAADILHPWFYFLYFETRSLPKEHQQDSKNIEVKFVECVENLMGKINPTGNKKTHYFSANMAMAMIQDRYLKHWKYKNDEKCLDEYANEIVQLLRVSLVN